MKVEITSFKPSHLIWRGKQTFSPILKAKFRGLHKKRKNNQNCTSSLRMNTFRPISVFSFYSGQNRLNFWQKKLYSYSLWKPYWNETKLTTKRCKHARKVSSWVEYRIIEMEEKFPLALLSLDEWRVKRW